MIGIGENIRILREMRGLTQKELAEASGLTTAALSRLERGDQFSTNKLSEIAKALNARVSDIDPSLKEDLNRLEALLASVPQRLKQARERAGYGTARVAAEALGVAYGTYSSHENGLRGIKGQDLSRYAIFFRVAPDWLQFGRGNIDDPAALGASTTDRQSRLPETGDDASQAAGRRNGDDEAAPQFVLDEVIAAFDGVLDAHGTPDPSRAELARIFARALAEPIDVAPGRARANARRAIARALVRALTPGKQG